MDIHFDQLYRLTELIVAEVQELAKDTGEFSRVYFNGTLLKLDTTTKAFQGFGQFFMRSMYFCSIIVNFEQISHSVLVFSLLTLNKKMSAGIIFLRC